LFEQVIHNVGLHGKKKKDMETRRQIVLLFAYLHVRLHAWQIKKRRESYIIEGTQEDAEALARSWSSRPGLSQAEAEAQEEEAELGEDDDGLDHPQQVEDDVLVQDLDEVDAREVASPEPPPAQRGGQRPDAQRPPRRRRLLLPAPPGRGRHPHLLPQPLPLPPAGHGGGGRPIGCGVSELDHYFDLNT